MLTRFARLASLFLVTSATASLVGCTASDGASAETDDSALTDFACSDVSNEVSPDDALGAAVYRDGAGDIVYAPTQWFVDALRMELPLLDDDAAKIIGDGPFVATAPVQIQLRLDTKQSDAAVASAVQKKFPGAKVSRAATALELDQAMIATVDKATADATKAPWSSKTDGTKVTLTARLDLGTQSSLASFAVKARQAVPLVSGNLRITCGGGSKVVHPQTTAPTYTSKGVEVGNGQVVPESVLSIYSFTKVIDVLSTRTDIPRVVTDAELKAFHDALDPKLQHLAQFGDGTVDVEDVHQTATAAKDVVRAFVKGLLEKTNAKIGVDEMVRQVEARKAGFITPFFPADDDYVLVLRTLERLEAYQHTFATEPFAK